MRLNLRCNDSLREFWVVIAMGAFASVPASASEGPFDVIHPYIGFTESYDANLLGLSNNAEAEQILGSTNTGDRSHTEQIGMSFDDLIGLQHLTGDVNASKTEFDRFALLDYQSKSAQGNWNWFLGSHLSGNLGATYTQSLAPYTFVHQLAPNLRVQKGANADIAWLFHPSWRIVASATGNQVEYDLTSELPDDRQEYRIATGIDYLQANDSSTGLQVARTRGYFPFPQAYGSDLIFNNYTQEEFDAKIDWRFSDKTRIQFVGGGVKRNYDFLGIQDYKGLNGRLIVDWAATAKLSFNAAAWHEIAAIDNLTTVYSINHGLSIAPSWAMTSKIRWDLQYKFEERAFAESLAVFDVPTPSVTYLVHNSSLMMTYAPTLHWQIQSSLYYLSQSSTNHSNDFGGKGAMCSMRYQF